MRPKPAMRKSCTATIFDVVMSARFCIASHTSFSKIQVYYKKFVEVCMDKSFLFALGFALTAQAFGAVYYVATDGDDSAAGSKEKPFATLNKANSVVTAGDTVWIRGGVYDLHDTVYYKRYHMTAGILLTASGESDDKRIHYLAYPGERPIFDGANLPIGQGRSHSDAGVIDSVTYTSPIVIAAKYLHLKGFDVRGVPMKHNSNSGIFLYASKHIFLEQIDSHHNAGPGIFINDGAADGGGHLILNCDAHDNYDPTGRQGDGENADGFGVHYQEVGDGDTTKFIGCRAWWNSDDGFDFINQEFPVVVENCYAALNGYSDYGTGNPKNGNGYGIKMGESIYGGGHHTIKYCVAWKNKSSGFYANYTGSGSKWYNNTSYMNGERAFNMASTNYDAQGNRLAGLAALTGDNAHVLKNNIAFPMNSLSQVGTCSVGTNPDFHDEACPGDYNNNWNLKLDLTEDDFLSLDDPSLTTTGKDLSTIPGILGPRNADGSLPYSEFLRLKEGSRAIDVGEDLGFEFEGDAPDLGAFEYGLVISSSSSVTPSKVEESSSSDAKSSNSKKSSSSSSKKIPIAINHSIPAEISGSACVFDLQGRYLGTLQAKQLRNGNIAQVLRAQFRNPGVYLVRYRNELKKVNVK